MKSDSTRHTLGSRKAQAVIELAVFGSIVIYLIGLIISQTTATSYQNDYQLQAMRMALLSSYQDAQAGSSKRNSANFVILEDRLSTGFGRYGTSDRQPFFISGIGTMSKHLFKPVDWSDVSNQSEIGVSDMRINGQHFELRGGRALTYRIRYFHSATSSHVTISQIHSCASAPGYNYCNAASGACETLIEDSSRPAPAAPAIDQNADAKRLNYEWYQWPEGGYPPAYVTVVKNDDANFRLPASCIVPSPPGSTQDGLYLRRFDLNRDGIFPDMCCPNPMAYILWQWNWKSLTTAASEIDSENGVYPSYDVTGDLMEDVLYAVRTWPVVDCGGGTTVIGYDASVLDLTRGDMNSAADLNLYSEDDAPGLKSDLRIITAYSGGSGVGTYMEINEQNNGAGRGRSTSLLKKKQQDYVERKFVLNDRMLGGGSFCSSAYQPLQRGVQACCDTPGCCGVGARTVVTCVEYPDCTAYPGNCVKKLFIRSNIPEERGRLWATDVTP